MTDSVVIGYLHPGTVRAEFMHSVLQVVRNGSADIEDVVDVRSGANISRARNGLVAGFLGSYLSDWLWMVDSDMVFAADTLDRLLASADAAERPILGGLYYRVNDEIGGVPVPVIHAEDWVDGERFPVEGTGAGCLLAHRTALRKIADVYDPPAPWFFETIEDGVYYGEDITFCRRAASVGVPVHVDTAIELGHVKSHVMRKVR